jgi:hypothetical protein
MSDITIGTIADHFDLALILLPNGDMKVHGGKRGYEAARTYFGFPQPFIDKPGEWTNVTLGSHRPATQEMVTDAAQAIERKFGVHVAVVIEGQVLSTAALGTPPTTPTLH